MMEICSKITPAGGKGWGQLNNWSTGRPWGAAGKQWRLREDHACRAGRHKGGFHVWSEYSRQQAAAVKSGEVQHTPLQPCREEAAAAECVSSRACGMRAEGRVQRTNAYLACGRRPALQIRQPLQKHVHTRLRTWLVEGGQERDVAVADADGILDKQVGEAVSKAPAVAARAAQQRRDSVACRVGRQVGQAGGKPPVAARGALAQLEEGHAGCALSEAAAAAAGRSPGGTLALLRISIGAGQHRGCPSCSLAQRLCSGPPRHRNEVCIETKSAQELQNDTRTEDSLPRDLRQLHLALADLCHAARQLLAVWVVEEQAVALELIGQLQGAGEGVQGWQRLVG